MSKLKNMSRGGYIVVGIVMALVLVPSGVAAALAYSGIEGSSGHEANVSQAGQLLTTEALPANLRNYWIYVAPTEGNLTCAKVATVPTGKAFVVQKVQVDVAAASPTTTVNGYTTSTSFVTLKADKVTAGCGHLGPTITSADAPAGGVGNVSIPITPGYVVPSGYELDASADSMQTYVYVTGYLVASADAPTSPEISSSHLGRP